MSKQAHAEAQSRIREYLITQGVSDHMFYGPVTDQYWNERTRLVCLNMEPYGYNDCGFFPVDRDVLIDWIYDAGATGTRTTRYSLALMDVTLAHIERGMEPSPDAFREAFASDDTMEAVLDRTTYYNIRPDSNDNKAQDFGAIASVGSSELGQLIWQDIRALDPHVLFVAGRAGLAALNGLINLEEPVVFKGTRVHPEGFLIQSIAHPSRPRYADWSSVVKQIGKWRSGGA